MHLDKALCASAKEVHQTCIVTLFYLRIKKRVKLTCTPTFSVLSLSESLRSPLSSLGAGSCVYSLWVGKIPSLMAEVFRWQFWSLFASAARTRWLIWQGAAKTERDTNRYGKTKYIERSERETERSQWKRKEFYVNKKVNKGTHKEQ